MINRIVAVLSLCTACLVIASSSQAQSSPQTGGVGQNVGPVEPSVKDPRSRAKLHTELGALYFQDRNIPVAMEELTIAIYIDPTYAQAYGIRALVHHYLKEPQHAETNFREALRYAPDDPEIANNYGWFLCQTGKHGEGMAQFERALRNRMYQTPELAYLNAGQCAMAMGDLKLAEEQLDKAYRLNGATPIITYRRGELYYKTERLEDAKREVADLMRRIEPNAETLWLAIRIERKLGDREAETRLSNQLRRRFPSSNEYQELTKGNYE